MGKQSHHPRDCATWLANIPPSIIHTFFEKSWSFAKSAGIFPVISIRPEDRSPERLTPAEREEASRTWVVVDQGIINGLLAHLSTALRRPLSYFRGIFYALKLGQSSPTGMLKNLIYLTEALLVGKRVENQGFTHVHVHFASTVGLFLQRIFPITLSLSLLRMVRQSLKRLYIFI